MLSARALRRRIGHLNERPSSAGPPCSGRRAQFTVARPGRVRRVQTWIASPST